MVSQIISCIQDQRSMFSALLLIQETLESGVMPKSFLVYNDGDVAVVMRNIANILKEKYGIQVPDTEL